MNRFEDGLYSWWLRSNIRDAYWWVRHRIDPNHRYHVLPTGLKPGYYDIDTLMLHGCMKLLERYVEDEREGEDKLQAWADELLDPNQQDVFSSKEWCMESGKKEQEALTIYRWWKYQWPEDNKHHDELLTICFGDDTWFEEIPDEHGGICWKEKQHTPEKLYNKDWLDALVEKIQRDEQEMLIRLVKIRESLWT